MVLDTNDSNYKQCSLSVMDNIADPDISFDEKGVCNYYYEYLDIAQKELIIKSSNKVKPQFQAIKKSVIA